MSYKDEAPIFGHEMLKYYSMDPNYINLNHGSYGTTPLPIQRAVERISAKIEGSPDHFMRLHLFPALEKIRAQLAEFLKVKSTEVVFTVNASLGLTTVLRNFEWEEGDIIFSFSTTYDSISRTVAYLSDVPPYPTSIVIPLSFPTTHRDVIEMFRQYVRKNAARPNRKRLAVIDSITALPSVHLPWQEIVKVCREEGVWSVVDAAHSIGQEVGLDLGEAAPDFWVSNCHKWLSAKRSCAIIYVPERNQHIIKSSIPTSHAYISPKDRVGPNFVEQFEWNGTLDHAAYLTIPDALEFRSWLGGEERINAYCRDIAYRGGQALAKILGTQILDPTGDMTLNMVNVELPIPAHVPVNKEVHGFIVREILSHNAYSKICHYEGKWWTRCSAQVWNEVIDFEKIGRMWVEVCKKTAEIYGGTVTHSA